MAYVTFYWGLFSDLRAVLAKAAEEARGSNLGVYGVDQTNTGFTAETLKDITDDIVVLPKIFRRLSTYIKETGMVRGFKAALEANREPVLDLRSQNITHFDTFVDESATGEIKLTRMPGELVFDPMPQRLATDFKAMLTAGMNSAAIESSDNFDRLSAFEAASFARRVDTLKQTCQPILDAAAFRIT